MPIVTPGKRPGVRLSRSKIFGKKGAMGKKKSGYAGLNLTPMVDMMTIIVIYLLQNFSAEGNIITISEAIQVPKIVTPGKIKRNTQVGVAMSPDLKSYSLQVEGKPVDPAKDGVDAKTAAASPRMVDGETDSIPDLVDTLKLKVEEFRKAQEELRSGLQFDGEINIQADMDVPFSVLRQVMLSSHQAGYGNMNFAGIQDGGGGGGGEAKGGEAKAEAH